MRVNERMKKVFSILLCLCMVLQYVPTTAFAVDAAEGGLCEHHAEHTAECGYAEAVEGQPCAHVHDELCGYIEAVAEVKCACEATDENGALVQRQVEMQAPCKHFEWDKPTITAEFTDVPGGVEIAVSGDAFTKGVMLDFEGFDCVLTDNFFSITDSEPYIVTARTDRSAAELQAALTVKTVYDIR